VVYADSALVLAAFNIGLVRECGSHTSMEAMLCLTYFFIHNPRGATSLNINKFICLFNTSNN
jgi:hypothetical protein